jgi:polysaccharide transporter, PST family
VKRQAGWIAAETAVGMLGTVLTTFLVSRLIGPAEVGRAALAGAVVMLAQPFVGYCFTNAMVQRERLSAADTASVLWTSLALALVSALPIAAAGLLLPDLAGPGVGPVLAALALVLPLNAVEGTANGVLLRRQRLRPLALRGIGAHLAGFAAGFSLALAGWGAWAVVGQQLAFFGTAAALGAAFARLVPLPVLHPRAIREMSPIAVTAAATGLAGRVGFRLFLLAVAGGSPALAGILQIAFRIVEVARELPTPFVHRYGLPALSRLRTDRAAFLRRLEAVCRLSGLAFAPVFAGLALCAPEVQMALLGPAWTGIVGPVRVLSATLALAAWGLPLALAFVAAGLPGVNLALTLGGLALALLLATFLVPEGSGVAAAGAWAAMLAVDVAAAGVMASRRLGFRPARQFRTAATALLPAAAAVAAVLGAEAAGLLPPALPPLVLLAAKGAIGAAGAAPLMFLLGRSAWREVARPVPDDRS